MIGGVVGFLATALVVGLALLAFPNLLPGILPVPTAVVDTAGTAVAESALTASAGNPGLTVVVDATSPPVDQNATPVGLFQQGSVGVNRGQFDLPRGIAIGSDGSFYVVDTQNYRVQEFDKQGNFVTMFGTKGNGPAQFNPMSDSSVGTGPGGIAVDKSGNSYVADTWNHRIEKFDKGGNLVAMWGQYMSLLDPASAKDPEGDSKFWGPRGVAVGPDGNVYVTDTGNKRVLIFTPDGKPVRKIDSGMTKAKVDANYAFDKPGELNEPIGIAVDGAGNVYVADTKNNRIQKFDKDGKPAAQWPVPAASWAPGPYLEPFLALDSAGNLYVTAPTGHAVLKFSPTGQDLGQKGTSGIGKPLGTPTGIAVGADGTVFVVDTDASAVIKVGTVP